MVDKLQRFLNYQTQSDDNLNIVVKTEKYIKAHALTKTNHLFIKKSILPPTIFHGLGYISSNIFDKGDSEWNQYVFDQ